MIIIDTSVWISFFNPLDSNHEKAKEIFSDLNTDGVLLFDYIYTESMTVFRNKVSDEYCTHFTQFFSDWEISISFTDRVVIRLATDYFFQFKKLSFTDCLLLASAKVNDYDIATFDHDLKKVAATVLFK